MSAYFAVKKYLDDKEKLGDDVLFSPSSRVVLLFYCLTSLVMERRRLKQFKKSATFFVLIILPLLAQLTFASYIRPRELETGEFVIWISTLLTFADVGRQRREYLRTCPLLWMSPGE